MVIESVAHSRDGLSPEVFEERQRCAKFVTALSLHWFALAAKIRAEGTFYVREIWPPPFKKVPVVRPGWERQALQIEDAARGLRHLVDAIKDGREL